ncbi:MAG: crosslink repair DNA glycosylase YcaQ family protein [Gaiellales bacterium]
MLEVPLEAARRLVVERAGFRSRRRQASVADVEATIVRLGCVQLDAISTVDRSQRLVLAVRSGRLPDGVQDRLLRTGRVFEYWAHEACLIPVGDWPYFIARMRDRRHHQWFGPVLDEQRELVARIHATIAEQGPVSSRDFGGAGTGYWNWSDAKRALEAMWTAGQLVVSGRRGIERMYDLPESVLPQTVLGASAPTPRDRLRYLIVRSVRARGLVQEPRVRDYYRLRGGRIRLVPTISELVDEGVLARVRLRESGAVALVEPADVDLLGAGPAAPTGAFLVSPFDNMLWDRAEAEELFGFEHRLEIYKPPGTRIYGYYVLPLIDGPAIVGRVDVKADRAAGILRAIAVHWQGRPRPRALREALERLAWTLGLERTEMP